MTEKYTFVDLTHPKTSFLLVLEHNKHKGELYYPLKENKRQMHKN